MVEFLLGLGLEPDALNRGGHTPRYSVANECREPRGAAVARALVKAGANVNARGGVERCTPLHMAARRANVEIAQALLDCGADASIKDKRSDTPLQRATNCRKKEVAGLLTLRATR
jgi:ankyrin repeat protein